MNGQGLQRFRVIRLNAETNPAPELEEILCQQYGIEAVQVEANTPEEIIPIVRDCDALFVVATALPRAVIDSLDSCRLISRLGNGTDKIDVARARERGIVVSNVPDFCTQEMADHAMGMLLALSRRLLPMHNHMLAGTYLAARMEGYELRRLSTCTLGLVGFGATARAVARRARAFGMRVIATRRNMSASRADADALGVEMADLDTVLRESDYLSLQLPLSDETYHLIDEAAINKMKPGAMLINTSRGALTDERALAAALHDGRLGGAAIDTFKEIDIFSVHQSVPDHPLVKLNNVILSPHVSALSVQAIAEVSKTGVENMVSVLSGHWPHLANIVNTGVQPRFPLADYDPSIFAAAGGAGPAGT
jgi:D-3-phosphoglycerate dehydrogenase / 2-oxoglutarate reductase